MKIYSERIRSRWFLAGLFITVWALLIAGCAGSGKPRYSVETYLLNYAAPVGEKPKPLAVSIKFNRFSIAAAYNTVSMIFRGDAYAIDSFNYSRWAVNPADMVADGFLRDLRASGLFGAVFSRHDADEGRFVLSGGIEEFYLRTDQNGKTAVIGITLSLQDTREKETGRKMLFQKKFSREEVLKDATPRGYCQAASLAMQALSREMTRDVYDAIHSTSP